MLLNKVFAQVVERVRERGDIRVGLDLLKRAVTLAEQDGRRSVTPQDVHAALESLGGGDVVNER